ncbi:MAG: hypothetical protein M3O22_02845, partial [Pseudomonadota bacterium]|nr:hypothetical protein [Pseudomonadota bacterium]
MSFSWSSLKSFVVLAAVSLSPEVMAQGVAGDNARVMEKITQDPRWKVLEREVYNLLADYYTKGNLEWQADGLKRLPRKVVALVEKYGRPYQDRDDVVILDDALQKLRFGYPSQPGSGKETVLALRYCV